MIGIPVDSFSGYGSLITGAVIVLQLTFQESIEMVPLNSPKSLIVDSDTLEISLLFPSKPERRTAPVALRIEKVELSVLSISALNLFQLRSNEAESLNVYEAASFSGCCFFVN